MLFRTVYGPELASIYAFVSKRGAVSKKALEHWFVQTEVQRAEVTNLEEAISFLVTLRLLLRHADEPEMLAATPVSDFRLGVLQRLYDAAESHSGVEHPLDPWFYRILSECFIRPNRAFIPQLHEAVNTLDIPVPCSEEKVTAWRRVMEYLGCGRRVGPGFVALYQPELLEAIMRKWKSEGALEEFLHFAEQYVPALTATGDMALSIAVPLQVLESRG